MPLEEIDRAKAWRIRPRDQALPRPAPPHTRTPGVTDVAKVDRVLARMEESGACPCSCTVNRRNPRWTYSDREAHFIDAVLEPLVEQLLAFPAWFSSTSRRCARSSSSPLPGQSGRNHHAPAPAAAPGNAIFSGGIRPHYYCLPILKRERVGRHSSAPRPAAALGFFAAPSKARPHERSSQGERLPRLRPACSRPTPRSNSTPRPLESVGRLDRLEAFASQFPGADFYGLPRRDDTITLVKEPLGAPSSLRFRRRYAGALIAAATKRLYGGSPGAAEQA